MDPADLDPRSIATLNAIMRALRTPGSGCPWDLEQTFETIAPYTIEEAYEVADAIATGSRAAAVRRARRSAVPGRLSCPHGRGRRRVRLRRRGGSDLGQDDPPPSPCVRRCRERAPSAGQGVLGSGQGAGARRSRERRPGQPARGRADRPARARPGRQAAGPRGAGGLRLAGHHRRGRQDRRGSARTRCGGPAGAATRSTARGTGRPAVHARQPRPPPRGRARNRAARGQRQVRAPLPLHRTRTGPPRQAPGNLDAGGNGRAVERGQGWPSGQ
jgi:hypothetical protein